jgi:hypothetical protein
MSDNHLTTPIVFNQPVGIANQDADAQQNQPKAVPCTVSAISGELVTVKFEIKSNFTLPTITIPQAYSQWVRGATQVGDKGFAVPGDYFLGGQSGQGTGTASIYPRGNLGTLVFVPITTKSFPSRPNQNATFINGPQGVILQDTAGNCVLTLTSTGVTITVGNETFTINANGFTSSIGSLVSNSSGITTTGSISTGTAGSLTVGTAGITSTGSITGTSLSAGSGTISTTGTISGATITSSGEVTARFGLGTYVTLTQHYHIGNNIVPFPGN